LRRASQFTVYILRQGEPVQLRYSIAPQRSARGAGARYRQ
jgi:hypothetical protein